MKKMLLLLMLITIGQVAIAQTNNGWNDWQQTSCYGKIMFRLKDEGKRGEQNIWKVQFKNNYSTLISFNYHITDKLEKYAATTHRKTLMAGKDSEELEIYTEIEDIFLLVDKVSLSPYPKNFINCE